MLLQSPDGRHCNQGLKMKRYRYEIREYLEIERNKDLTVHGSVHGREKAINRNLEQRL